MKWKNPPVIKIYEALGAVADGRVEVSSNTGKVYSSTRNKYYDVIFEPDTDSIMTNDNGSYWQGYLGYPAIAYLMKIKIISYDEKIGKLLKGIAWKDINQKFKNNFEKTLEFILEDRKAEKEKIENFVSKIEKEIKGLKFNLLGKKALPPEGY